MGKWPTNSGFSWIFQIYANVYPWVTWYSLIAGPKAQPHVWSGQRLESCIMTTGWQPQWAHAASPDAVRVETSPNHQCSGWWILFFLNVRFFSQYILMFFFSSRRCRWCLDTITTGHWPIPLPCGRHCHGSLVASSAPVLPLNQRRDRYLHFQWCER